jgi:hypothetical protein
LSATAAGASDESGTSATRHADVNRSSRYLSMREILTCHVGFNIELASRKSYDGFKRPVDITYFRHSWHRTGRRCRLAQLTAYVKILRPQLCRSHSIHRMADRPLAQCDALRCTDPVYRLMRVSPPGRLMLQARVCYVHSEAIERGERWMWHHGGGSGRIGQRSAIAMGADLPPIVTEFRMSSGHFSDRGGTELVQLELLHGRRLRRRRRVRTGPGHRSTSRVMARSLFATAHRQRQRNQPLEFSRLGPCLIVSSGASL